MTATWEPDQEERDRTLFVSSLAEDVTEDILYELFLQAGPVLRVALKNTGGRPPIAFVTFEHSESVPFACAVMDGTRLFRRAITAKPREGSVHVKKQQEIERDSGPRGSPHFPPTPPQSHLTPEGRFQSPPFGSTPRWRQQGSAPPPFPGGPFPLFGLPIGQPQMLATPPPPPPGEDWSEGRTSQSGRRSGGSNEKRKRTVERAAEKYRNEHDDKSRDKRRRSRSRSRDRQSRSRNGRR